MGKKKGRKEKKERRGKIIKLRRKTWKSLKKRLKWC